MINGTFGKVFAGLLAMAATVGLPVTTDPKSIRRVAAGIVRQSKPNRPQAPPGTRLHRRAFLPDLRRRSCRFVYARPDKQLRRDQLMYAIQKGDRIENAVQARRIEMRGTRIPVG